MDRIWMWNKLLREHGEIGIAAGTITGTTLKVQEIDSSEGRGWRLSWHKGRMPAFDQHIVEDANAVISAMMDHNEKLEAWQICEGD